MNKLRFLRESWNFFLKYQKIKLNANYIFKKSFIYITFYL